METCCFLAASFIRRFFISCLLFFITPLILTSSVNAGIFSDDLKRTVEIKQTPSRIVSLAPSITEILFALDLNKEVVGVTQFSNYPPATKGIKKVGSYIKLNIEVIVGLSPDLIIATADGNPRESVEKLEELGIPVFVIYPKKMVDIYRNLRAIGAITGKIVEAERLASSLEGRINAIANKVRNSPRPKVFLQLGTNPLYTAGKGTFMDQLIELAGGVNIVGGSLVRYPAYSMEEVLSRNPDFIFSTLMDGNNADIKVFWKKWDTLSAVKSGRIFSINPDLVNRPSPRIADGLEAIAKKIHPEIFLKEDLAQGEETL
ncbi:MAG: cobalamin-binding protein [Proteobacteria bacterium]|nr:cobalamin-binding protein [Pseudomonadota bacterium]